MTLDTQTTRARYFDADHIASERDMPTRFVFALIAYALDRTSAEVASSMPARFMIDRDDELFFVDLGGDLYAYDASSGEIESIVTPCAECCETGIRTVSVGPFEWAEECDCAHWRAMARRRRRCAA